jgi:hypothetical protein
MSRPRKPTAVLEASGAFDKNPSRAFDRMNEPRPTTSLGPPPDWFLKKESGVSQSHLAIWRELEAQAIEGVLTGSDRFIFESTCRLMYRVRSNTATTGDFAQLKACLSELGLTPAARTRVAQRKAKEADKRTPEGWAALAEELAESNGKGAIQ